MADPITDATIPVEEIVDEIPVVEEATGTMIESIQGFIQDLPGGNYTAGVVIALVLVFGYKYRAELKGPIVKLAKKKLSK